MRNHQKGVAALEFAILLIPLLFIVFGATEFGRIFYEYNTLLKSTRSAARYLSTQSCGDGIAQARNLAVYGTTAAGAKPLLTGLTTDMVIFPTPPCRTVTLKDADGNDIGSMVVVSVTISGYQFTPLTVLPGRAPGSPVSFTFADLGTTMRRP